MKKTISLIIVIYAFIGFIKGQNAMDSLKSDTIELCQYTIVIDVPLNYHKSQNSLEYGGCSFTFAAQPAISIIGIMVAANSDMDFGEYSIISDKIETEHSHIEKGICSPEGFFRCDYYKGTRIKIFYKNVSENNKLLFDGILNSVRIIKKE